MELGVIGVVLAGLIPAVLLITACEAGLVWMIRIGSGPPDGDAS